MSKITTLPTVVLRPVSTFRYDKREDGWELVENVELSDKKLTLQFDEFLKRDESYVKGTIMMDRAKGMGSLAGQLHAERLLDQQESIPKELRNFYFVFTGTVWCNPDGDLHVPYLYWNGVKWILIFDCLDDGFDSSNRLARLSK
jgi:hypothetical protein